MLTVIEAAKVLRLSRTRVYALAKRRTIAHYRVGGKILFAEADVQVYLASCRVEGERASPTKPPAVRLENITL